MEWALLRARSGSVAERIWWILGAVVMDEGHYITAETRAEKTQSSRERERKDVELAATRSG